MVLDIICDEKLNNVKWNYVDIYEKKNFVIILFWFSFYLKISVVD